MTIRKEEHGWKTLGRKRAEYMKWKLYHAIQSAKLTESDFSDELKDKVRLHHTSYLVTPLTELFDEICETYKLSKPTL